VAADESHVRKHGLTAAGLLLAGLALFVALSGGHGANAATGHTCSATDKQFISAAQVNLTSMDLWGQQYLSGSAKASDVVERAEQAAQIVGGMEPRDPSLTKTRNLLDAMFTEYGRAIQAKGHHRDAGPHMYRAYGLANFAHDVLVQAQPALKVRGCDVTPLL
jgi:hypothetical protein